MTNTGLTRSTGKVLGLLLLSSFAFSQSAHHLKKREAGITLDWLRNQVKTSSPHSGAANRSGWAVGAYYQRKIAFNYWGRIETNYTLSGF